MPNAENGCTDLKNTFIDHVFGGIARESARWRLVTALSGAHTIGRANLENSGFDGPWSDEDNQHIFNNDYYKSLVMKGWAPKEMDESHHQWERVDSTDKTKTSNQMMLNSDICLAYQNNIVHRDCVS